MRGGEVERLVQAFLAKYRTSQSGWARGSCPFCVKRLGKPDRRGSFGVFSMTGRYNCFRCGASGRARLPGTAPEAADERVEEPSPIAVRPPEGFVALSSEDGQEAHCLEPARRYIESRGVPAPLVEEIGIGACPTGRYSGRVVVPVKDEDGQWLWWVGRAWRKQSEKPYMYPAGARGDVMFNHATLLKETDTPAIIVEGVFDAIAFWPDAVAVLGKPTPAQVYALASARRPIAVVLDGDAWEEGEMLALKLRFEGQRAGSVHLPPRVDPDEVDRDWLRAEARSSLGASQ